MSRTKQTPKKRAVTRAIDWKPKFLDALRNRGIVKDACDDAHVGRATAYEHRKIDAEFARQWGAALEEAADTMEAEAHRRAVTGIDKPVFGNLGGGSGSGVIGAVREYSDTLLIFLLKGARPKKYRERYEHSGPDGGPIPIADLETIRKTRWENAGPAISQAAQPNEDV